MLRRMMRGLFQGCFVRFAAIGLFCLMVIQQPTLVLLVWFGSSPMIANAGGFVLSGVVNYGLQRRKTFGRTESCWWTGLGKFQFTSLLSLGVQSAVFGLTHSLLGWWLLFASFISAGFGTGFHFIVSRKFTFGLKSKGRSMAEKEIAPRLSDIRDTVAGKSLAYFMPAYCEAGNLPRMVRLMRNYFALLGLLDFRIIIVNDGSPDNTGLIADGLADMFDEVEVIHHPVNRGYGGALITGFNAVVNTGFDLWAFSDADGQFAPSSLGTLLHALVCENADMAVGRRIGRKDADSHFRFLLGRAWHFFGKVAVGKGPTGAWMMSVSDVDCGLKVGRVKSLARIVDGLRGQAAAISPELIARANRDNARIVECGVTHLPRHTGSSTGDRLGVMVRSGVNVLKIGILFRIEKRLGRLRAVMGVGR